MTSNSPALPPLPQDPPASHPSIHSTLESAGSSFADAESYAGTQESTRSSRSSGIYGEITRTFKKLQTQLLDEKRRADEAERRLGEVTAHLKTVNEARLRAMQDAAQAREDLRLYKIQLDHAQREIFRAQDAIAIVDRQRLSAEKDAAKNRSKARQLNETLVVQAAREEAWRVGLQEGLNRGRNIALAEISDTPYGQVDNTLLDEESSHDSPDTEREEEFPINLQSAASSVRSRAARESRVTSFVHPSAPPTVPSTSRPQSRAQSVQNPEPIRPVSIQTVGPSPRLPSPGLPIPDNFIPSLDADNRIRIPAPFEFSRTPERPASPQLPPEFERSMEVLPIPPPEHSAQRRRPGQRRNSSSGSSTLSALDIINEPFGGALRTPMSAIQEVASQYSGSPHHPSVDGNFGVRQQPSFSGSMRQPPSSHTSSVGQFVIEKRPTSRASFAGSHRSFLQEALEVSPPPDIAIQPPSRDASFETDSLRGGSRRGMSSPAPSQASQIRILPPYGGESSKPSSLRNGMPGGLTNIVMSTPTDPEPSSSQFVRSPRRGGFGFAGEIREDDAVSSALSAGTLTTPPGRSQALRHGFGDAETSASAMGRPPSVVSRLGSINTAVYSAPDSAATEDMTGVGTVHQIKKKGKKKK